MTSTPKPDPKLKSIYRASFNAKIAKTISLAHLGSSARQAMYKALPKEFHSDFSLAVHSYLKSSSTGNRLPIEPSLEDLKPGWANRAKLAGVDIDSLSTIAELSKALGVAKIKLLSTPGAMEARKQEHFEAWVKEVYKELFPIKKRAKKLSEHLYRKKHEFLAQHEPVCYHHLPSGDIRPYYEIRGWQFHGEALEEQVANIEVVEIPDFEHLKLNPISDAYTKDPWEDVFGLIGWKRGGELGEAFFMAAHDDFQNWLQSRNKAA